MKIDNSYYGGFVVSKNILEGYPIRYSFREKSEIPELNGWTFYPSQDDDAYVNNSKNFIILSANSLFNIAPIVSELYEAPYGTDLYWIYEEGVHIGFYDLVSDKETTIDEIVNRKI